MAIFRKGKGPNVHCGGTIFTEYHVITAAHCFFKKRYRRLRFDYEHLKKNKIWKKKEIADSQRSFFRQFVRTRNAQIDYGKHSLSAYGHYSRREVKRWTLKIVSPKKFFPWPWKKLCGQNNLECQDEQLQWSVKKVWPKNNYRKFSLTLTVKKKLFHLNQAIIVSVSDCTYAKKIVFAIFTSITKRIFFSLRIHRHPQYYWPRAFSNDIAIVEVRIRVPLDRFANIKPICLPNRPYRAGTVVRIVEEESLCHEHTNGKIL